MSFVVAVGPDGRTYEYELEYVEGVVEGTEEPWRGYRVRYRQVGSHRLVGLFMDGLEETPPSEEGVLAAVVQHHRAFIAELAKLPRWRRTVVDPTSMSAFELYSELNYDVDLVVKEADSRRRRLLEARILDLCRELRGRKLSLPASVRAILSGGES